MTLKHFLPFLAAAGVSAFVSVPLGQSQKQIGQDSAPADFTCHLPPILVPGDDGLPSGDSLFSSHEALLKQVKRHQAIVRVPSICYDDLGEFNQDERWAPFYDLHDTLAKTYPTIYRRAKVEKINTFGLVYTIQGSDTSLKPLLLAAHQDVVPVADASTWTHPPFDAYWDGDWLWGRGASDDKNSLTALMSAVETLLSHSEWTPTRTVVLAFGFDEECSGYRGAGKIGEFLTEKYGDDGIALILDEGGLGMQLLGDTLYVLPSVMEKGHVDIWADLHVAGGHSSIPFPHTGIGIAAELITALEAHPYTPEILKGSPVYDHLVCIARYSPDDAPEITRLLKKDDLAELTSTFVEINSAARYMVQTSQAIDMISGGQKINAMPEVVSLGVNYRVAPQDSILKVQHTLVNNIESVVKKYNITVKAFEGDKDYEAYKSEFASEDSDLTTAEVDYNAVLVLKAQEKSEVTPIAPTSGPIWDIFSGTIQHAFSFEGGKVVPVGEIMNGNTDTRHYLNLSPHVYRFTPTRQRGSENIHTVDERVRMDSHLEMVKFYYDLVRNFDAADV
ncbi:hypothetical protein B0T10DRAFT_479118 [Thelonectria olida]|uniref:Peptidase M20 dimerisation domain-containing protein n=1 Tax=Thelonectria olida TaxID=1576542 RepID=A0A9P8WG65_9HYPO|nr:hypothetical protein B0T10DRAFT_479118 [Thelonectria olida]